MAEAALKGVLKLLPCRPAELGKFQKVFVEAGEHMIASKPAGAKEPLAALATEYEFLLSSQKHLHELNMRYFPQSGMTEREVIEATARRVGFNMPKLHGDDTPSGSTPPPSSSSQ